MNYQQQLDVLQTNIDNLKNEYTESLKNLQSEYYKILRMKRESEEFDIFLKSSGNETLTLKVYPDMDIFDIYSILEKKLNIEDWDEFIEKHCLWSERELQSNHEIRDYPHIKEGSTIHLIQRLLGCKNCSNQCDK